ncbi:hypothetical protein RRG08_030948 [Elysia crispata]|uniref:Uncharacterized protein n=1 Tax=Elysia crispata TaxID=231223 RepID=A0AAE1DVE6_9GAST|nr:hypothetical protein RRG08_030948 [Elysia crispata]
MVSQDFRQTTSPLSDSVQDTSSRVQLYCFSNLHSAAALPWTTFKAELGRVVLRKSSLISAAGQILLVSVPFEHGSEYGTTYPEPRDVKRRGFSSTLS